MKRDDIARLRRRVGVVHQDCQFLDHLTVAANVALPLTVASRDVHAETQNLMDLLSWVGMTERTEALPPSLSGGERQRAALARAVIMDPEVLIDVGRTGSRSRCKGAKHGRRDADLWLFTKQCIYASSPVAAKR